MTVDLDAWTFAKQIKGQPAVDKLGFKELAYFLEPQRQQEVLWSMLGEKEENKLSSEKVIIQTDDKGNFMGVYEYIDGKEVVASIDTYNHKFKNRRV